ncbi:hypothetical protein KDW_19900 [Dictyobacter vulcani]|uniref:Uncharacterized protein n=1 Tax=Dictyobacter vulcani TaxID=2607529 RepID=A0A5J4KEU1_9CHLR|nr:hypothetical protein KDW_19900 [Dictyobacter vulcani]
MYVCGGGYAFCLTASFVHLYTIEDNKYTSWGGFDSYASVPLTPYCFLFK